MATAYINYDDLAVSSPPVSSHGLLHDKGHVALPRIPAKTALLENPVVRYTPRRQFRYLAWPHVFRHHRRAAEIVVQGMLCSDFLFIGGSRGNMRLQQKNLRYVTYAP